MFSVVPTQALGFNANWKNGSEAQCPCQLGAVHTWLVADVAQCPRSVLQEGQINANIRVGLGAIRRMSAQ
jgi:hypothetical protein